MTHWSTYLIPFVALGIAVLSQYYGIDMTPYHDLLVLMGIGGIPLTIAKKAIDLKSSGMIDKIMDELKSKGLIKT